MKERKVENGARYSNLTGSKTPIYYLPNYTIKKLKKHYFFHE